MTQQLRNTYLPLTPLQDVILAEWELNEGKDPYILQLEAQSENSFDIGAITEALRRIVAAEPTLRACFRRRKTGEAVQAILPEVDPEVLTVPEYTDVNIEDVEWESLRQEDRKRGFDLNTPPLIRAYIGKTVSGGGRILISVHHIIVDGWSLAHLMQKIVDAYQGIPFNPCSAQDSITLKYLEWLSVQNEEADIKAFQRTLGECAAEGVIADQNINFSEDSEPCSTFILSNDVYKSLTIAGEEHGATFNDVITACWGITLSEYLNTDNVAFTSVDSGRYAPVSGIANAIGMFAAVTPIRVVVGFDESIGTVVERVRNEQKITAGHRHVGVANIRRNISAAPVTDTLITFQGYRSSDADSNSVLGIKSARAWAPNTQTVTVSVTTGSEPEITMSWKSSKLSFARAQGLVQRFEDLLKSLAEDWNTPIVKIKFRSVEPISDGGKVIAGDNYSSLLGPLLIESAQKYFSNPAVLEPDGRTTTYEELYKDVSRMARWLSINGVAPGDTVALQVERNRYGLIALLGVIVCGGSYYPVDAGIPNQAVRENFKDVNPAYILTTVSPTGPSQDRFLDVPLEVIDEDFLWNLRKEDDGSLPDTAWMGSRHKPDQVQQVIFTSGSTGRPKGVMVTKRALANVAMVYVKYRDITSDSIVAGASAWSFDIGLMDFLSPLLAGAQYIAVDQGLVFSPDELGNVLKRYKVTHFQATPTYFSLLVKECPKVFDGVIIIAVGEAFSISLASKLYKLGAKVINGYGPTETTVISSLSYFEKERQLNIGYAIPGNRLLLLDRYLRLLPLGAVGEIYIAGESVAHGYLERASLTAARFVANPYGMPGELMYRTGDLGQWDNNGEISYIGRADSQVKVQGHRIECGSIEAAIVSVKDIAAAAVIPVNDSKGNKRLVAFVEGKQNAVNSLSSALSDILAAHEIPSRIIYIDALPRTSAGKVNRSYLAQLKTDDRTKNDERIVGDLRETQVIRNILESILDLPSIHDDDDFYLMGGDSYAMIQISAAIRKEYGVKIPLSKLIELRTAKRIYEELAKSEESTQDPSAASCKPRVTSMPVPANQAAMWFLDSMSPEEALYNISVAFEASGSLNSDNLRKALVDVIMHHPSLHSIIEVTRKEPVWREVDQDNIGEVLSCLQVDDLCISETLLREAGRPFDLLSEIPFRAILYTHNGRCILQFVAHHAAVDGASLNILSEDISNAYNERQSGNIPFNNIADGAYEHFAILRQGQKAETGKISNFQQSLAYWRDRLADAPETSGIPYDLDIIKQNDAVQYAGFIESMISYKAAESINFLTSVTETTRFSVLAWATFGAMRKMGAQNDLILGVPVSGRTTAASQGVVSCFVNTLPIRNNAPLGQDLTKSIKEFGKNLLEDMDHQEVPFSSMVESFKPYQNANQAPYFQSAIALELPVQKELILGDNTLKEIRVPALRPKFDLFVEYSWHDNGRGDLVARIEYNRSLYREETITGFMRSIESVLCEASAYISTEEGNG